MPDLEIEEVLIADHLLTHELQRIVDLVGELEFGQRDLELQGAEVHKLLVDVEGPYPPGLEAVV